MDTNIDWSAVRADLDSTEWEYDRESHQFERRSFLGTCFGLTPSGKYYTPWANGNVDPCPACGGSGQRRLKVKRRVMKKWRHA